jgi:bifunctional non-homologous end joining protein LigD
VQQHAARSMHWDLRLEIDGVLASWAVPRGPSLDPATRRLAVHTEDHPMEYADFEGVIPEGNYGAGAMIVWDRGSYHTADGESPAAGLAAGKIDLVMNGHKLRGRFALVKTRGGDGSDPARSWLLIRKDRHPPEDVRPEGLVEAEPRSVLSGLTVQELRDSLSHDTEIAARATQLGASRREVDPRKLRPMLARTAEGPFSKPGWIFELKYDGMRVIASRDGEAVRLTSRGGHDVTAAYPEVARALAALPLSRFVLDGELTALDESGRSSFERLQKRFAVSDAHTLARAKVEFPVVLFAFDLLSATGHDLRPLPLHERKALLECFVPALGQVRYADHVEEHGDALFEAAADSGLEGVIAKRIDSRYQAGRRSDAWLKIRVPISAKLAVVGWEEGRGARKALGSLALAWQVGDTLRFAGKVGSGLDDATVRALLPALAADERATPAFENAPDPKPRGVHYVDPRWVAEVRYTEVTSQGLLRHPVLLALHDDVPVRECVAPPDRTEPLPAEPAASPRPAAEPELRISRREKVFWPDDGYTKGDLLDYYEGIWPWLAPYLRDRPVVLTRYPDGIEGKSFFQQNAPEWTPDWATHERIDGTDFFVCNELRTLLHVINSGAIPLHVWGARTGSLDHPDWSVIDLDPKAAPFADVVAIARHIHHLLDALETRCFVKTSGQAGLHVLIPLDGQLDHDGARALAEVIARVVVAELPEIATIARPIAARGDKVYVDFGQNGRGRLIVAPFSVRPKPGAPVSTPLAWSQVTRRLDPARWNIRTTPRQMKRKGDPLAGLLRERADIARLLDGLGERLA